MTTARVLTAVASRPTVRRGELVRETGLSLSGGVWAVVLAAALSACGTDASYTCHDIAAEACHLAAECDETPDICVSGEWGEWCFIPPEPGCEQLLDDLLGCRHAPESIGACLSVNEPLLECKQMRLPNGCRW